MYSHVTVGIGDFGRAFAFWSAVMEALGHRLRFHVPQQEVAAWEPAGGGRPLFFIGHPFDGNPASAGNGQMTAFLAPGRPVVDAVHALALANGGTCEGPPGLRPHYHPNYYGAYFRDPDGNKVCVCCHEPDSD
ncbi:MAG: VOC family protein [Alphaproteobacteria bacterium]|nr:VOC family protein [Alphaproteobacteria bacterium]